MNHVHTYADGFGVWHAEVPRHLYADPAGAARRAIRREIALRDDHADMRAIGTTLHNMTDSLLIYRETVNTRRRYPIPHNINI